MMDFERICRICGEIKCNTKNLYENKISNEDVSLHQAFTFVTSIDISHTDGFPNLICCTCLKRLTSAYIFKRQAEKTNMMLRGQTELVIKEEMVHQDPLKHIHSMKLRVKNEIAEKTNEYINMFTELDHVDGLIENDNMQQGDNKDAQQNKTYRNGAVKHKSRESFKHTCQVCGRSFLRKSNLVDHLRLHANVKPFECKHCDKSFVQMANFKTHLRIHTNERPYECHYCSKTFNQSGALKIHIRSHTQERNYVCNECGKSFTNSSDLNKHLRVHSPDLQYKCDNCEKLFSQKQNLRRHSRKVHAIELG